MPDVEALSLRVGVLGAGVAGLATAVALRRRAGVDGVTVFERDGEARFRVRLGHGLLLMQNGLSALRALGCEGLLEGFEPLHTALLQDERGLPLRRDELRGVYCVTRAGLMARLLGELPAGTVRFERGCEAVRLETSSGGGARRRLSEACLGGESLAGDAFDLWVGAEGVRSPLCRALNPELQRPESRVWEIVTSSRVPAVAERLRGAFVKTYFVGKGLAFGLLPSTRHDVIGFAQLDRERYRVDPASTPEQLRAFLLEVLRDAPEIVTAYLRGADLTTAHLWRPLDADMPTFLACDNAVMVGDAAHPVLPFTSQGVSAALEDAIILADAIAASRRDLRALPATLAGFAEDRRRDVRAFIEGGRAILRGFVDEEGEVGSPYVDGAVSQLEEHLALPRGNLPSLMRVFDADGDGLIERSEFGQALDLVGLMLDGDEEQRLFDELDHDRDGRVRQSEIFAAVASPASAKGSLGRLVAELSPRRAALHSARGRALRLFRLLDDDRDGWVSFDALATYAGLVGVAPVSASWREAFEVDDGPDGPRVASEVFVEGMVRLEERRARAAGGGAGACVVTGGDAVGVVAAGGAGVDEGAFDPLFGDDQVDVALLRQRAFNHRWATVPEGVIPLTAADLDFPVAVEITEAIARYAREGCLSYGPAEGLPLLREAAAERLRARRGVPCEPGRIFVTDSAASALFLAAKVAIDEPGAEAIIADPVDFLLERSVVAAGGRVRRVPLRRSRQFRYDLLELEAAITPHTRLISLCNPHNPLGRVWSRGELEGIVDIALRRGLRVLSDEVWADIVYEPARHTAVASLGPEAARITQTVYGFSKGYGLAGLRVGLLVSPDAEAHQQALAASHALDTAYGVSTLSQVAAAAAYREADGWLARFVAHLRRQRDHVVRRLSSMPGVTCHVPEGTFVAFPDVRGLGLPVPELVERLRRDHGLAVVPGSPAFFGPGAEGHVRLAFATSRGLVDQGLDRFEACARPLVRAQRPA